LSDCVFVADPWAQAVCAHYSAYIDSIYSVEW